MADALNTRQIECILSGCLNESEYLGTFAKDELRFLLAKKRPDSCAIVNNQPRRYGGQHWLALYFHRGGIDFFDSFGKSWASYGFVELEPEVTKIVNERRLQSPNSPYCAHYCIYYLYHRQFSRVETLFDRSFGPSTTSNDEIVFRFVNSLRYNLSLLSC